MRGAIIQNAGRLEIVRDLPDPDVGPGDVLVEVNQVAICKSETDRWTGAMGLPEPLAAGHEIIGTVVHVGDDVTTIAVGDRVVPYVEPMHGLADLVAVPATRCVKLPDDADAGVLTELLACAVGAVETSGVQPTDSVALVGGTGALGELIRAVLSVRFPELSHVFVLGRKASALADARADGRTIALGVSQGIDSARESILRATGGRGADVVMEVSGAASMLLAAPTLAATSGTLAIVGYPATAVMFDWHEVCGRGIRVAVAHWRDPDTKQRFLEQAAELIVSGLGIGHLITHRFPFDALREAFDMSATPEAVKVVVTLS